MLIFAAWQPRSVCLAECGDCSHFAGAFGNTMWFTLFCVLHSSIDLSCGSLLMTMPLVFVTK